MENKPIEIILIEDNLFDAELAIRALRKANLANKIIHIADGREAMQYLLSQRISTSYTVILLDLRLPRVDGLQILQRMKSDFARKEIPIVVLTSSVDEIDLIEAYQLNVNAYIVKPVEWDKFVRTIKELKFFWLLTGN